MMSREEGGDWGLLVINEEIIIFCGRRFYEYLLDKRRMVPDKTPRNMPPSPFFARIELHASNHGLQSFRTHI